MYVLINQMQILGVYWEKNVFKRFLKVTVSQKRIFQQFVFLIKVLQVKVGLFKCATVTKWNTFAQCCKILSRNSTRWPLLSQVNLSSVYLYIQGKVLQFQSNISRTSQEKIHNFWSISDYYFPALNGNNSLCISSIQKWSQQASCLNLF